MRISLWLAALLGFYLRAFAADQPLLGSAQRQADVVIVAARRSFKSKPIPAQGPSNLIIPHFQQKLFPANAGACGLKSFTVMDYEIRSKRSNYEASRATEMGAVIETTSPECIRDFGVVQFIRGCVYNVRYLAQTGAEHDRSFNIFRRSRGSSIVFNHPDYEVDQMERDPLYVSSPNETDRLALAYVPHSPLRLSSEASSLRADWQFFDQASRRTFLKHFSGPTSVTFVTDHPYGGISYVDREKKWLSVVNSSLDFKTCVYRLQDVPTSGDPAGEDTAPESGGPIQCFRWASRYTYDVGARDFATDRFQGVDSFCAQAPR